MSYKYLWNVCGMSVCLWNGHYVFVDVNIHVFLCMLENASVSTAFMQLRLHAKC